MNQEEIYQEQIESVNLLIYEAEETVRELQRQKRNLLINRYMMRTGLKVGDVVKWREWGKINGKHGDVDMKGRILGFDISFDRVQPNVVVCKKDGTDGLRMRNYWNGSTQPIKV